ncbi:MAG: hypothetical protein AAF914_05680 [Pseudomonadota bacterium]
MRGAGGLAFAALFASSALAQDPYLTEGEAFCLGVEIAGEEFWLDDRLTTAPLSTAEIGSDGRAVLRGTLLPPRTPLRVLSYGLDRAAMDTATGEAIIDGDGLVVTVDRSGNYIIALPDARPQADGLEIFVRLARDPCPCADVLARVAEPLAGYPLGDLIRARAAQLALLGAC